MSYTDFLPQQDGELAKWLANFTTVANSYLTMLRLTTADVQTVITDTTQFNSGISAADAAKIATKAATQTRLTARKKAVKDARALVKRIQSTPGVTDDVKAKLQITVSSGRRPSVPVFTPATLSAHLQANMSVVLKWTKSGNTYGTGYVVERKTGTDTAWTAIKTVTAARFVDNTNPPGTDAIYRVIATRGKEASMPSPEASVYPKAASASAAPVAAEAAPAPVILKVA